MSKIDNNIFLINLEGYLEINKPEARNIPEYKTILIRDKGSEGDHDGRKKLFAFKELMFTYLYYHPLSMYRELPDEYRFQSAKSHAELPDKWKIDEVISSAGKAMVAHAELTSIYHTYVNANRSIYSLGEDVKFFNERREKLRKKLNEKVAQLDEAVDAEEIQKLDSEVDYLTTALMKIAGQITTINDSLPKAYETIEKLKQKILDDEAEEGKIYGGGTIGNREN